jgi:N6-adenosine-specific RNA methylase IME4
VRMRSSVRSAIAGGLKAERRSPFAYPRGLQDFGTILADPPWQFHNRTGKIAPEHEKSRRYATLSFAALGSIPVARYAAPKSHLYLWVPNALVAEGLTLMKLWGFHYKTNVVWCKIRRDGGPDGRGVGFYFRNVTELVLFGVRGGLRTLDPGRTQTNIIRSRKREHSRKPDEIYDLIESCSPGPFLELFARHHRGGWTQWGDEDLDRWEVPKYTTAGYSWDRPQSRGRPKRHASAGTFQH